MITTNEPTIAPPCSCSKYDNDCLSCVQRACPLPGECTGCRPSDYGDALHHAKIQDASELVAVEVHYIVDDLGHADPPTFSIAVHDEPPLGKDEAVEAVAKLMEVLARF